MTQHQRNVIEAYKSGLSLRQTGQRFGISHIRVYSIIQENEPDALRTWLFNKWSRGRKSIQHSLRVSCET